MALPVYAVAKPMQRCVTHDIGTPANNFGSEILWIGNVSPSVSRFEMKVLFEQHGEVLDVFLRRARSFAFVHFKEISAAKSAMDHLQGHFLGGNRLKIEFAKSARPCSSLWVARISKSVGKEELEEEFIKFGNIKEVRFFRCSNTACIDFFRAEDAIEALKSMNGKKIGDDFIVVDFLWSQSSRREQGMDVKEEMYLGRKLVPSEFQGMTEESKKHYPKSCIFGTKEQNVIANLNYPWIVAADFNEFGHGIDSLPYHPGPKPEFHELPFRPLHINLHGFNCPVLPGCPPHSGFTGSDVHMRPPLSSSFTFKPDIWGYEKSSPRTQIGGPNWRQSSPLPGIGSSSSADFNLPTRHISGHWDVSDSSQLQRKSKRSRFDSGSFLSERIQNQGGLIENYGLNSQSSSQVSAYLSSVTTSRFGPLHAEGNCIWRGVIAKGGSPVFRARCIPIGEGINAHIPDVINCFARTDLDKLSKHCESAIGFNTVSFFPDSEDDLVAYTDFLRFLVSRGRAMVAKFDDGTTLFLVPPSDFVSKLLNISGPECLYGTVLKFPQVVSSSTTMNLRSIHNSNHSYSQIPMEMWFHQNEHHQSDQDWGIQESISRTVAEDNEQYKAATFSANLPGQIHQQNANQPM